MLATICSNALVMVSFDLNRGGESSLGESPNLSELRQAIAEVHPAVIYRSLPALTAIGMAGADVAFISSVRGGHDAANPLTISEQQALYHFVLSGGLAILITDNDSFSGDAAAANASIAQMFGLLCAGTGGPNDVLTFNTSNWAANGPFGDVSTLFYSFAGAYSSLGPHAHSVGDDAHLNLCGAAIIERNELGIGSGAVFFTSDSTWTFNTVITGGKIVIKNILSTLKVISGNVNLESFEGDPNGRVINISIRQPGGDEIVSHDAVMDTNGNYSFSTGLATGTYDVAIKPSHWLRKNIESVSVVASGATGVNCSVKNGDCDGDNEVTIVDFSMIATAFGSSDGEPNYQDAADLDGDLEVTLVDLGIMSNNFGQEGD